MSLRSKPLSDLRILEIGDSYYFHHIVPQQTDRIWSSHGSARKQQVDYPSFTPATAWRLLKSLREGKYDLIVLSPLTVRLWRPNRWFGRNLLEIVKRLLFNFEYFGLYWVLKFKQAETPAIVLDMADTMIIRPENFWMFPLIKAYFKRELPQNNWHTFLYTNPKNEDVSNIRRQKQFQEAMAKIRPFTLGKTNEKLATEWFPEKEFDVFYVGENSKSTVRMRGVEALKSLIAKGYRIDMPSSRIGPLEYAERCKRAWLVWSPEGSGWDCGRHYESLVFGSVPVMNYPTIERYQPLIDTRHCLFYSPEGEDLQRVIEKALQDKDQLKKMVREGRDHLNQFYSNTALVEYLLSETERTQPNKARCF